MDLHFHNRLAYNNAIQRRRASPHALLVSLLPLTVIRVRLRLRVEKRCSRDLIETACSSRASLLKRGAETLD